MSKLATFLMYACVAAYMLRFAAVAGGAITGGVLIEELTVAETMPWVWANLGLTICAGYYLMFDAFIFYHYGGWYYLLFYTSVNYSLWVLLESAMNLVFSIAFAILLYFASKQVAMVGWLQVDCFALEITINAGNTTATATDFDADNVPACSSMNITFWMSFSTCILFGLGAATRLLFMARPPSKSPSGNHGDDGDEEEVVETRSELN